MQLLSIEVTSVENTKRTVEGLSSLLRIARHSVDYFALCFSTVHEHSCRACFAAQRHYSYVLLFPPRGRGGGGFVPA